jgi:ribosomal protein S27E
MKPINGKINGRSRCSPYGTLIQCPECNTAKPVYHLSWSALVCQNCGAAVEKGEWLLVRQQTPVEFWEEQKKYNR